MLFLGRDRRVSRDQHSHDTADGFQTHGQRRDVQQQEVLDLFVAFARQNGGLDGGAVRDSFVRVDGLAQLLTVEEVGEQLLHLRDSRGTANQDNFVHLTLVELGVSQALLNRFQLTRLTFY